MSINKRFGNEKGYGKIYAARPGDYPKWLSKNIGALKDQLQIDPNLFSKDITSNDNDCCKHFFEERNVSPRAVNSQSWP